MIIIYKGKKEPLSALCFSDNPFLSSLGARVFSSVRNLVSEDAECAKLLRRLKRHPRKFKTAKKLMNRINRRCDLLKKRGQI